MTSAGHTKITLGKIEYNEEIIFNSAADFSSFAKEAAQTIGLDYPKFHKMDALSKLTLLAAEPLLKDNTEKNIAILLSNTVSSLDTDLRFQETIASDEQFFPSPAVFVYTLPNICIGELCIKHQLHSENCFFVTKSAQPEFLAQYAAFLLAQNKAKKVLCGFVEILGDHYEAALQLYC